MFVSVLVNSLEISILAVLADRDKFLSAQIRLNGISILAVLADRDLPLCSMGCGTPVFQSSRSLRTATVYKGVRQPQVTISILAVLADRDGQSRRHPRQARNFNPRGPCGPRRNRPHKEHPGHHFNPRGPCGPRPFVTSFVILVVISILAVLADRDHLCEQ